MHAIGQFFCHLCFLSLLIYILAFSSPASFCMFFNITSHSSVSYHQVYSKGLYPFCTFSPTHCKVICGTFNLTFCCLLLPSRSFHCYLKCYVFKRVFFTLWCFLHFFPHLLHASPQPDFIKASPRAGISASKIAGLHIVVQNTVSALLLT